MYELSVQRQVQGGVRVRRIRPRTRTPPVAVLCQELGAEPGNQDHRQLVLRQWEGEERKDDGDGVEREGDIRKSRKQPGERDLKAGEGA